MKCATKICGDFHLVQGLFPPADEDSSSPEPMISWRIWVSSLSSSIDLRRSVACVATINHLE